MENRDQDAGPADRPPGHDGRVQRDGPRFPHADEIDIPDGLSVEPLEPARRSDEPRTRRLRGLGHKLWSGVGRLGTGLRGAVDRALLVATFLLPLLILAYQSFEWLRTSRWPSVTMEGVLAWLGTYPGPSLAGGWAGLGGLLELLLGAPLAAVLFVAGLCLHVLLAVLVPSVRRD